MIVRKKHGSRRTGLSLLEVIVRRDLLDVTEWRRASGFPWAATWLATCNGSAEQ